MADAPNPLEWQGRTMVDGHGDKVGKVDAIYVDDSTGDPAWALVHTGMFGSRSTFVPLREASLEGDDVHVPYEKTQIKDAPSLDAEEELSPDEERQLYDYYGVDYAAGAGRGHEGHDHESHDHGHEGHDHGDEGHDHDHAGHDHDHEHDAHDRGVGDPTPDQPVGGVEGDPTSGRPEVGQTVNPGQPVGGQVAAGAQQVGEKRLRRYTIVTEEVVREVIPVEDDAPGTEQPGPDQPPR